MTQQNPRITGEWTSADQSENRLEMALTETVVNRDHGGHRDTEKLIGIRDTHDPAGVIYATPTQMKAAFGQLTGDNPAGRLISEASRH